ncbi:DUF1835 domain-containing protein [Acaryochloris sp. 'Moss Beach']|uniref:DUF1835 domain-containing protein n=1 Tax=Acaryochloris sp. 'Moss Beach' TaxID=2740837 RepID=UPI001F407106|nr:DUF1835 domain-containing protein [Acaryochloris sp. 'Moss Beach']UJB71562.1 DUF1835 domain-containing protein [Acaryochloris sp. 'Moss Beach']
MPQHPDSKNDSHLNLEQQRKRAKDILKKAKAGDPVSIDRFQKYHPDCRPGQVMFMNLLQLADAQLVIARENRFSSWSQMKAHIDQMERIRNKLKAPQLVPQDADCPTLHIRCGSDLEQSLQQAGFVGDYLAFTDPFCQGPVQSLTSRSEYIERRAGFMASAYQMELEAVRNRLRLEYHQLQGSHRYPRIVLWFEADSYDQLSLSYLLHYFRYELGDAQKLELICIDSFPGIQCFRGLGQLPVEALPLLWSQRQSITTEQMHLCDRTWQAVTAPSPKDLWSIATSDTSKLSALAPALMRHLQEFPWVEDGLSLTERLTLTILAEGACLGQDLFQALIHERDPLPYLGDTMYWFVLQQLLDAPNSPLTVQPGTLDLPWPQRLFDITPLGLALLHKQQHWRSLQTCDRWLGGVQIQPNQPCWQWNQKTQTLSYS